MLSLRAHVIIAASLFAALIAIAVGGNILQATGVIHDIGAAKTPMIILIFGLFLAFGFSCIPVMVKLVLGAQRKIGNENMPAVAAALRGEKWIVYGL